jgi:hypothetical protein
MSIHAVRQGWRGGGETRIKENALRGLAALRATRRAHRAAYDCGSGEQRTQKMRSRNQRLAARLARGVF